MPISHDYAHVHPSAIRVLRPDRQRREIITDELIDSIKARGVLQPVIVTRDHTLVAGERRWACCTKLDIPIPVRYIDSPYTDIELQIMEFEENAKRSDLTWQESARAVAKIHGLYRSLDPDWTMAETAAAIGCSKALVATYTRVVVEMETPKISLAATVNEALGIIKRREQRSAGDAFEEILGVTNDIAPMEDPSIPTELAGVGLGQATRPIPPKEPDAADTILNESFLEWAPKYKGRKFNLIHCDFPYGIEVFKGPQSGEARHQTYDDSQDVYFALLECLCVHLDKFMAINAHLMFWYSAKHRRATEDMFAKLAPSLQFYPFDLIWTKSDNAGIAGDHRRHPRHTYETCMFAYRGGRNVVQTASDVYSCPTDKKWHPSTKPEPMLKYFFQMLVDGSTSLLDPTCGGGSSIRAAEASGAAKTLGLEIDPEHCANGRLALKQFRALRAANREI